MYYKNLRTGTFINLRKLSTELKDFYDRAFQAFMDNVDWMKFDDLVFGPSSPLYRRHKSHRAMLSDPLYKALKDMWLQLGVQQGKVLPVSVL